VPAKKSQFCHLGSTLLARQQRDASFFYIMSIIMFAVTQETPALRIFGKNQELFLYSGIFSDVCGIWLP
jgi:hypothetical protein